MRFAAQTLNRALLPFALILGSVLIAIPTTAQQNNRAVLLKGITNIPLPGTSNHICPTYIFAHQPEIITTAIVDNDESFQFNNLVTTSLEKGKIVILGSSDYFSMPLLKDPAIRLLIKNLVLWGCNTKTPRIQLGEGVDSLRQLLAALHFSLVPKEKKGIDPSTNILFLAKDVTDTASIKGIENFVRQGGTLIFGSSLAQVFEKDPENLSVLRLNELFLKAGVFHGFNPFPFQVKNGPFTDSLPYYLHINSILKKVTGDLHYSTRSESETVISTVSLAIYYGDDPIIAAIKKTLAYQEGRPIIPTTEKPVYKDSVRQYLTFQVQNLLLEKRMEKDPDFNKTYIAPASKTFPGEVPATAPRVNEMVSIPVHTGSQGLWEPEGVYYFRHSTGLYVPAGERVSVCVAHNQTNQHLKIQVGAHDDNLFRQDYFTREPYNLTSTFEITKDTTEIYSSYGGILYLNAPDTSLLKAVTLNVHGAVKYPYFKSGVTEPAAWKNAIRNYEAPWAELATDKIILTVPAYRIRNLEDPEKIMRLWDEIMDADAKLAAIPASRPHPERIIIDKQVANGYMFTSSEKIVGPDDDGCAHMLDETFLRANGLWGHFHELGHRHQFWGIDFKGLGEVTENLYSMYVFDKVLGKGIYQHEEIASKEAVINKIKKYMAEGADFQKWCSDPFLALCMYIEIIEGFGWPAIETVYKEYRALPKEKYPATEEEKRDYWFKTLCTVTQKDLSVFFDKWGVPVTEKTKKEVSAFTPWLPDELK